MLKGWSLSSNVEIDSRGGEAAKIDTPGLELLGKTLGVALAVAVLAVVAIEATRQAGNVAPVWVANAFVVAVALRCGGQERLLYLAAAVPAFLAANLLFGDSLVVSVGLTAANLAEILAILFLLGRLLPGGANLRTLKDGTKLLVAAGFVGPLAGALVGALVIWQVYDAPYWAVFRTWWKADAAGMIVFLPFLLVVRPAFAAIRPEAAGLALLTLACAAIVGTQPQHDWFFLLLLPLILTGIRLDRAWCFGNVGMASTVVIACKVGAGTISGGAEMANEMLLLQLDLSAIAICVYALSIQIAAHKLDIRLLEASEARIQTLYNKAPIMLHSIDPLGRILTVSDHWLEKMGYRREEVIGRKSTEFLTEASKTKAVEVVLPAFMENGECHAIEYDFVTKSGSTFPVLLSATSEKDRDGKVQRSLAVSVDVTKLHETEQSLRTYMSELERSNAELEQFAYIASHDLQEPLRMVSSFSELLERRYGDAFDEEGRQYLHFTKEGAQRMKRMLEDLLAFSRLYMGDSEAKVTDSAACLSAALANLRMSIEDAAAFISHGELPWVTVDPAQLEQLFQNLIGNAIKFRGEEAPNVTVEAVDAAGMWRFTVADNGIGLDRGYKHRIFEVFRRLHARDKYQGSGIGLAICKKIVENHGGRIWVESEPGEGCRFHFTLPGADEVPGADGGVRA